MAHGLQQDYKAPAELSSIFFSVLATQLIDALCSATASPIEAIENELSRIINGVLTNASSEAIAVIQGRQREGVMAEAYALGQLGFAHQLAAKAAHSRIDESFLEALKASKFSPYLEALYVHEMTNKQLKQVVGHSEENISRRMKELRDEGITDFRKNGTHVINFLTPVARQIIKSNKESADEVHAIYLTPHKPEVDKLLKGMVSNQPLHMRNPLTFDAAT